MWQIQQLIPSSILVIFITLSCIGGIQACNLSAVNQCVVLLNSSTSADVLNEGLSAIPPTEVLMQLCRARQAYKSCYDPLAVDCTTNFIFSMTFGIIDKTLTYLCVDGYQEILQHEQCWNKTEVKNGTLDCHSHQNDMIAVLRRRSNAMDTTELRNNWCSILDNTSSCMTNVVNDQCGPAPACIMQTMMTRALAGLADLMRCALEPDCSNLLTQTTKLTSVVPSNQQPTRRQNNFFPPNITAVPTNQIPGTRTVVTPPGDVITEPANEKRGNQPNVKDHENAGDRTESFTILNFLMFIFLVRL